MTAPVWRRRAACRDSDDHLTPGREWEARLCCWGCPVARDCEEWALTTEVGGVAGGMTEDERVTVRAERGIPEPRTNLLPILPLDVAVADRRFYLDRKNPDLSVPLRIAAMIDSGLTAADVSLRTGLSERGVVRYLDLLRSRGLYPPANASLSERARRSSRGETG